MRTKYLLLLILLILSNPSMAQPIPNVDTVIYTPRNVPVNEVKKYTGDEYTIYESDSIDNSYMAEFPGAILLERSTLKYNCHGYA